MPIAAAVAGGAALLGGFMANRGRSKEAQKDRNFQERMSSTSWQRGKADMEAAGINPALAYSKGGASTPGGAQATQEDIVTGSVSSAMQAKRLQADLKNIEAQTETQRMLKVKARADANQSATQAEWNIWREMNEELIYKQHNLAMPWLRSQSRAATKYGDAAAVAQMFLNSGGSQLATMATGGIMGSIFKNARLGPKRGPNPTYPGRLSGRGR